MNKRTSSQIQSILEKILPELIAGETTLDAILSEYEDQAEQLRPHIESALWLVSQQSSLDPRPGYISASKQRLVNRLKTQKQSTWWERIWRPRAPQLKAAQSFSLILLVLTLALVVNNLVIASRLTLPGDWLYSAKLNIEQIQLALTMDTQEQARLQIEFTQRRTTEIVQLVLENDTAHLGASVDRLASQIDRTLSDLERARGEDSVQATSLASSMQLMLENEAFIMQLLSDMQPAMAGLNQAINVTLTGLDSIQN